MPIALAGAVFAKLAYSADMASLGPSHQVVVCGCSLGHVACRTYHALSPVPITTLQLRISDDTSSTPSGASMSQCLAGWGVRWASPSQSLHELQGHMVASRNSILSGMVTDIGSAYLRCADGALHVEATV